MDDAALVEAARGGDGAAWGAIYDRYADRLHDHCHRILRDRDEAADALHDAFIAASTHLDQLRDPSRLRPWLYSICRHEALKRVRRRQRVDLVGEVDEMSHVEVDHDRGARAEELQELVWSAAAGLNERDQALLDLNLRQGLDGQDLADAMGTSLSNSYVMVSRLRDQVERSLGALLIARLGRDDCDELGALLVGWDGTFSPILRKRVARHVDGCAVCSERRAAAVSPLALLAAAPLVPAPATLRTRVLEGVHGGQSVEPVAFTTAGFAAASAGPRRRVARPGLIAAVVLVLAGLAGVLLTQADQHDTPVAVPALPTTTTASTTPPEVTTTTEAPSISVGTSPGTDPAAPPSTDDPVIAPPPDTTPPAFESFTQSATALNTTSCDAGLPKTVTIAIRSTDAVSAILRWAGAAGSGQVAMVRSGPQFTGAFGSFPLGGTESYVVEIRDAAGNVGSSPSRVVLVNPCPG